VGIIAAARISQRLARLEATDVERIKKLLTRFALPVSCPGVSPDSLLKTIRYDKKTTLGQTRWVLVEGIGRGVTGQAVAEDVVSQVLEELCR
jgi:3-dehydroquinate synthase